MRNTFPFIPNSVYKKATAFAAAALIASPLPAALARHDIPNITIDETHDPFYQDPFQALLANVQETVPRAYGHITRQWGLDSAEGLRHPLVIQIKEDEGEHLQRRPAYTQLVGAGDQIKQYLVIDLGTYIQYPQEDVRRMLTHEMAHVILNDSTAGAKATAIPRWLHEGLAQSVTGEGHEAVQKMFAYWKGADGQLSDVGLCDLDGAVDEFAHGPDNAYCYPEYYLAVQRLRQLGGPHTLPILLKGLREGMSINDLIERLAGLDAAAFQAAVQRYASDIFSGRRKIP